MSRMKLLVCTWNVGNAAPPSDLSPWLDHGRELDIVVVGGQEANFSGDAEKNDKGDGTPDSRQGSKGSSFREMGSSIRKRSLRREKPETGNDSNIQNSSHEPQANKDVNVMQDEELQQQDVEARYSSHSSRDEYKRGLIERLGLMEEGSASRKDSNKTCSSRKSVDSNQVSMVGSPLKSEYSKECQPLMMKMPPAEPISWKTAPKSTNTPQTPSSRQRIKEKLTGKLGVLGRKAGTNGKEQPVAAPLSPASSADNINAKRFSGRIEKALGDQYVLIAKHHLMEIKLLVFVHQRIKDRVIRTKATAEATGLGHVVGNKGGVAVKVTIDDTTFCFVSSHLAAHEGAKFLKDRNEDVTDIMRNIEKTKMIGLPAVHQFDHLIWLGDLNYRLDLDRFHPKAQGWDRTQKLDYVKTEISKGNYGRLCRLDELAHEMNASNVFGNFQEGKITFMPTFKTVRNTTSLEYQDLRIPSYCDRILWHSLPLHRNHLKLKEYQAVPEISTSDHKPVYALFNLFVPKPTKFYAMPAPSNAVKCTVDFHSLKLVGLYEKESTSPAGEFKLDVLDENDLNRGAFEDSLLFSPQNGNLRTMFRSPEETKTATKRTVRVEFYAGLLFAKQKAHRTEVPLRNGLVRECKYDELPAIPLVPLAGITELTFKYITIVFSRMGTRQGASCVLPLANLVQAAGNRTTVTLDLTKYGGTIAQVEIDVELVCSMHCWITSKNKIVKVRRKWKR